MRTDIKFSYKEYAALPETGPKYQLVEGELVLSPSPNFRHQILIGRIFNEVYTFVKTKRLGTVLSGPIDVILSDEDVFVPDLVFISKARKRIEAPEGLRGAPDLVVEVLSPSNRNLDRETKRVAYARYGVEEYWIVDPKAGCVEVFHLQKDAAKPVTKLVGRGTLTTPLLPGFELTWKQLFGDE